MRKTRGVIGKKLILQIEPIAALEDGTPIYPIMGSEDDPQEGGDGDDDEEDSEDEDGDEDESGKDKDEKPKRRPKSKETPEQMKRRLNREAKEHREAREAAEAKLREIEDKDKSELEIAKRDLAELQEKFDKVPETMNNLRIENAFLRLDRDKYNWHDPSDALDRILKDPDVTLNEDGSVEGLEDAVKALAKSKPYLLKKKDADDGEEEDKGKRRPPRGPSGASLGGPKSPKGDQKAQRADELKKKYKLW